MECLYGTTEICDENIPFSYDEQAEKITLYLDEMLTIPDGTDTIVGRKLGAQYGGNILYKLSVPLSNSVMTFTEGKAKSVSAKTPIREVDYFIENYQEDSRYSEMRLQFPELNRLLPSVDLIRITDEGFNIHRKEDSVCCIDIRFADTDVSISFDIGMTARCNSNCYAETTSLVTLKFPKTDDVEYVILLYNRIRAFFSFICNRKNIGLRSATLIGECPCKQLQDGEWVDADSKTEQTIVFSQKYFEPEEEENRKMAVATISGLFADKLKELCQLFFEEERGKEPKANGGSSHRSLQRRRIIDLEQSLNITAAFEFYVRTMLPEISSEETLGFYSDLHNFLSKYINEHEGSNRKKAKDFDKQLIPRVSLEEKIKKAYNGYSDWASLKPVLADWFGEDVSGLAEEANLWRNELAHGTQDYIPNENTIHAVRLVEHLNYCIVLRYSGYCDEDIKGIVEAVLFR